MKEILIKDWDSKRLLGLNSSEYFSELTNYEITESSIKREECTIELHNDMKKNSVTKSFSQVIEKITNKPGYCIFVVCKNFVIKMTDYFFTIIDQETASI